MAQSAVSDTVRVHRRLRQAGVAADLNVYEGFSHADYNQLAVPPHDTPEAAEHYRELNTFLLHHLPVSGAKSPRKAA